MNSLRLAGRFEAQSCLRIESDEVQMLLWAQPHPVETRVPGRAERPDTPIALVGLATSIRQSGPGFRPLELWLGWRGAAEPLSHHAHTLIHPPALELRSICQDLLFRPSLTGSISALPF